MKQETGGGIRGSRRENGSREREGEKYSRRNIRKKVAEMGQEMCV